MTVSRNEESDSGPFRLYFLRYSGHGRVAGIVLLGFHT
jgi:hypothetical protein